MISVLISTKNRSKDLVKALESLNNQTIIPEILVVNDGSTDDTYKIVTEFFPNVKLISHANSKGYIVRRNEGIAAAQNDYVLSIDDDCVLEFPTIIEEIVSFLKKYPDFKSVAWPHRDVYKKTAQDQKAPSDEIWQIHSFKGCSFIVHKHSFISVGGFPEVFIHQGEEEDLCIKLLNKNIPTVLGLGNYISHYESLTRNWARMDFFGSRNLLLFAFFNIPSPLHLLQALRSTVNSILYGFKIKRPYEKTRGVWHGWKDAFKYMKTNRKPVSKEAYKLYRTLKKHGAVKYETSQNLILSQNTNH